MIGYPQVVPAGDGCPALTVQAPALAFHPFAAYEQAVADLVLELL